MGLRILLSRIAMSLILAAILVQGIWENIVYRAFPDTKGTVTAKAVEHSWLLANMLGFCLLPTSGFNLRAYSATYFR